MPTLAALAATVLGGLIAVLYGLALFVSQFLRPNWPSPPPPLPTPSFGPLQAVQLVSEATLVLAGVTLVWQGTAQWRRPVNWRCPLLAASGWAAVGGVGLLVPRQGFPEPNAPVGGFVLIVVGIALAAAVLLHSRRPPLSAVSAGVAGVGFLYCGIGLQMSPVSLFSEQMRDLLVAGSVLTSGSGPWGVMLDLGVLLVACGSTGRGLTRNGSVTHPKWLALTGGILAGFGLATRLTGIHSEAWRFSTGPGWDNRLITLGGALGVLEGAVGILLVVDCGSTLFSVPPEGATAAA